MTTRPLFSATLMILGSTALLAQNANSSTTFSRAVGPFLQKNCQGCHNSNLPSGNLDMQALLADANSLISRAEVWENIAYQLRSGNMPPAGSPKPDKAEADNALELLSRALAANPRAAGSPVAQA